MGINGGSWCWNQWHIITAWSDLIIVIIMFNLFNANHITMKFHKSTTATTATEAKRLDVLAAFDNVKCY